MAKIDMTGKQYGRLTAIKEVPKPKHIKSRATFWLFKCECGNEVILNGSNVRSGNTASCGCLKKEKIASLRMIDLTNQRFGKLITL